MTIEVSYLFLEVKKIKTNNLNNGSRKNGCTLYTILSVKYPKIITYSVNRQNT